MKQTLIQRAVLGCAFALAATGAEAVMLLTDAGGRLTGATGVDVLGASYNVAFRDTTCLAAFGSCDTGTVFAFPSQTESRAAALALMSQVITGIYDSQPNQVLGCDEPSYCLFLLPYRVSLNAANQLQVHNTLAGNHYVESSDSVPPVGTDYVVNPDTDLSVGNALFTYAVWSSADVPDDGVVPEPGALALMGLGLGALRLGRRR